MIGVPFTASESLAMPPASPKLSAGDDDGLWGGDRNGLVADVRDGDRCFDVLGDAMESERKLERIGDARRRQQVLELGHVELRRNVGVRKPVSFKRQEAHAHVAHVYGGGDRREIDVDARIPALDDLAVEPGELVNLDDGSRLRGLHVEVDALELSSQSCARASTRPATTNASTAQARATIFFRALICTRLRPISSSRPFPGRHRDVECGARLSVL